MSFLAQFVPLILKALLSDFDLSKNSSIYFFMKFKQFEEQMLNTFYEGLKV